MEKTIIRKHLRWNAIGIHLILCASVVCLAQSALPKKDAVHATPAIHFTKPAIIGYDAYEWTLEPIEMDSQPTPYWFWAAQSAFQHEGVFYMGLQPNGQYGKTALFSFFGKGTSSAFHACAKGADDGDGTSCHIPYNWKFGHAYKFHVQQNSTNKTKGISTWKATVTDTVTNASSVIGVVSVPASWGLIVPGNLAWAEWFRGPDPCNQRTYFRVRYNSPIGYRNGIAYPESAMDTTPGTCATYTNINARTIIMSAGNSGQK